MTKPSDLGPAEALDGGISGDAPRPRRSRWALRVAGAIVIVGGWLAVALADLGTTMFVVDTIVFLIAACYAFGAPAVTRLNAVNEERKLRLRLLLQNAELENLALRDELTQVSNRRHLFDRLHRELETAKGFHRPLAFIAIELRSLSQVNLERGYGAGDGLLAAFGRFLLDFTRGTDLPARMSGNTFAVILPDTSKYDAHAMVDRLTSALAVTPLLEDPRMDSGVAAFFGVSGYPWGSDDADSIVRMAESEARSFTPSDEKIADRRRSPVDIPEAFRRSEENAFNPETS